MRTHIDDVASVFIYDDLREVVLAGTSSSGAVISGVADRVPERISRQAWQVTDEVDLRWMLPRLRPTPGFDRYAQTASQDPHWRLFHLAGSHLPYITSPHELAPVLLELAAS
jgi:hypothetical protein